MTTSVLGEPKIASAESCEVSANKDLYAGTVLGLIAGINAELALLDIRPDATTPIAVVAGVIALPFLQNAWANYQLAKKHRAGISVPG
jgi:hypothetical protein